MTRTDTAAAGPTADPVQRCIDVAARGIADRLEAVRLAHLSRLVHRATREVDNDIA